MLPERPDDAEILAGFCFPAELARPIPAYIVHENALDDDDFLAAASQTSWLYLVMTGSWVIGTAEAVVRDDGRLAFVSYGPRPAGEELVQAIARAEEAAADGQYALRYLSSPELFLRAIWLSGSDDLVVPISVPPDLEDLKVLRSRDLVERLRPVREHVRSASTSRRRSEKEDGKT